VTEMSLPAFF